MTWQYWTVSEKSRANAERLTSCLPRLSDLSRILVFGLNQISHILNSNKPFASEGPLELLNTRGEKKWNYQKTRVRRGSVGSALACNKAGPSSILGSVSHGGSSLGERRINDDTRTSALANRGRMNEWLYRVNDCQKQWHNAQHGISSLP
jgi:hypothetical protein